MKRLCLRCLKCAEKTKPELPVVADEHTVICFPDMSNVAAKEDKVEEKPSIADDGTTTGRG